MENLAGVATVESEEVEAEAEAVEFDMVLLAALLALVVLYCRWIVGSVAAAAAAVPVVLLDLLFVVAAVVVER